MWTSYLYLHLLVLFKLKVKSKWHSIHILLVCVLVAMVRTVIGYSVPKSSTYPRYNTATICKGGSTRHSGICSGMEYHGDIFASLQECMLFLQ